jgi:rhomboid protease GluP
MPATLSLIAAIVAMFVFEAVNGIPLIAGNFTDADVGRLVRLGAITPDLLSKHAYWRLFAAMFIHIGLLHLILNLWALYQLGAVFEMLFGKTRFLLTYFGAGLCASLASAFFARGVAAGASGAIFGILGALILAVRRSPVWRHQPWALSLSTQLIGWAALNVIIGFRVAMIDNAAHLGGLAAGLLLGLLPHRVPPPPPQDMVIDVQPRS